MFSMFTVDCLGCAIVQTYFDVHVDSWTTHGEVSEFYTD